MAKNDLYLDILCVQLNKITDSKQVTTPTKGVGTRYTTQKEPASIKEVFSFYDGSSSEEKFKSLFTDFLKGFNSEYIVTKKGKGISMNKGHWCGFRSQKFVMWGEFSGGNTGREQKVFNRNDSENSEYTIAKEKMVASPFFFMFWLPMDSNTGILMVQRYSTLRCTDELMTSFSNLFIKAGYKPAWEKYVPKAVCEKFLNGSAVTGLTIHHTAPKEEDFAGTPYESFSGEKGVQFTTSLKGLGMSFAHFLKRGKFADDFKGFISMVDKNYSDSDDVKVTYTDTNGKSITVSLSSFQDVLPPIMLEADCFNEATNTPNWEKIKDVCSVILEGIKKEIGYTPMLEP